MLRCMVLQEQQHEKRSAKGRRNQRVFLKKEVPECTQLSQQVASSTKFPREISSISRRSRADIEKIEGENGTEVTFDKVICIGGDTMKVGADVAAATVTGTVMDQGKGKKVVVYHYKRKTGYHKKNGHRQLYTRVKIDKING